ncbi:MAG: tRNA pseudouridine(13) synthase TruD [Myxococcota bacterium]
MHRGIDADATRMTAMDELESRHDAARRPPRLAGDEAPCPGAVKAEPEDFRVDEIPAYAPAGEGEHCFLHVEKRDLTTQEAIRRLARALGVPPREIGAAGQTDRRAVTTQWLSVPGVDPADVADRVREAGLAEGPAWLRVLGAERHPKKLRTGHLRGNRFTLVVRDVDPARASEADALLARLGTEGLPNYFGEQRFGRDNLAQAHAWLALGGRAPKDRFRRRMFVSAHQSGAFNAALAARVRAGELGALRSGEVCRVEASGGLFVVAPGTEDAEQARADAWETSPTGPLFGAKMPRAEADAGAAEERLEGQWGFGPEAYARMGKLGQGTRRPVRVRPEGLARDDVAEGWQLRFTLPPGSYATVLLRELFGDPPAREAKPAPAMPAPPQV